MFGRPTSNRETLMYARMLIEVGGDQTYPEKVQFKNERGIVVDQEVYYPWKPVMCKICNGCGHVQSDCVRQPRAKKV